MQLPPTNGMPTFPDIPTTSRPGDAEGPAFSAPWQAQAFAMVLALHARGVFTWPEWAAALSGAITSAQAAGDPDTGHTYYRHWVDALETLVQRKGLVDSARLHALEHAWEAAAARTPHGQPIVLTDDERAIAHRDNSPGSSRP